MTIASTLYYLTNQGSFLVLDFPEGMSKFLSYSLISTAASHLASMMTKKPVKTHRLRAENIADQYLRLPGFDHPPRVIFGYRYRMLFKPMHAAKSPECSEPSTITVAGQLNSLCKIVLDEYNLFKLGNPQLFVELGVQDRIKRGRGKANEDGIDTVDEEHNHVSAKDVEAFWVNVLQAVVKEQKIFATIDDLAIVRHVVLTYYRARIGRAKKQKYKIDIFDTIFSEAVVGFEDLYYTIHRLKDIKEVFWKDNTGKRVVDDENNGDDEDDDEEENEDAGEINGDDKCEGNGEETLEAEGASSSLFKLSHLLLGHEETSRTAFALKSGSRTEAETSILQNRKQYQKHIEALANDEYLWVTEEEPW